MSIDPAAVRALAPAERRRLERFAAVFERLDASRYATLTEGYDTADIDVAKSAALELLDRSSSRRDATRSAVRAFTGRATAAYAERFTVPQLLLGALPDRAADRLRFLASLERVVVALVLWDDLGDGDRQVLVGPWAALLESVVSTE